MNDMKSKTRTLSVKSVKSVKSVRSFMEPSSIPTIEKLLDLEEYIANACSRYLCPYKFIVKKDIVVGKKILDEYAKLMQDSAPKNRRISLATPLARQALSAPPPLPPPISDKETEDTTSVGTTLDNDSIPITALYDNLNRLVELLLQKISVPRMLIQILGLILPHYLQLAKISVKKCKIDAYIIYEIKKFLPLTTITEICLDGSPVMPEANYAILLATPSHLTSLSLCRCKINDEVCKQIATKLHFSEPGEGLLTLNLSSNHITDEGAKHLGEALRTNRHLRYLNLAGNRIGDDGAHHIFNALIDFPLTYDEIRLKRQRFMSYLRAKQAICLKYSIETDSRSMDDISMVSKKPSRKSTGVSLKPKPKKDKMKLAVSDEYSQARAETLAFQMIGPFTDPFLSCSKVVDGHCHCIGNMVLSYLNLRYNNLSYLSLKKLQTALFYQSVNKKPNQTGLLRVLVEGNQLPIYCSEMDVISEMLNRNVINFSSKYLSTKQRTRARMSTASERK